jgi:hypothetical protein
MQSGEVDVLLNDYSEDAILTTFEGVITGRPALRRYFEDYLGKYSAVEIVSTDKFIEALDGFYVESTVREDHKVTHVYNGFVVRDGKITHQFASVK